MRLSDIKRLSDLIKNVPPEYVERDAVVCEWRGGLAVAHEDLPMLIINAAGEVEKIDPTLPAAARLATS